MPHGNFKIMPHVTIIMNDGDLYFKKKISFMSKNLHSAIC